MSTPTAPLKLVLTSRSAVKVAAVEQAIEQLGWDDVALIAITAPSDVPEQPIGEETEQGALNRIRSARQIDPDGELYVSIENGLFLHDDGEYVDRAVVVVEHADGQRITELSEGVVFPHACVEEARRRGFATTTVGHVMAERGIVAQHDDPHLALVGKSRKEFLVETTRAALQHFVRQ